MSEVCSIDECGYPRLARGLCRSHYQRAKYAGTLDEVAPNPSTTCQQCSQPIPAGRRWGAKFCSTKCKQDSIDAAKHAEMLERRAAARSRVCAWCREPLAVVTRHDMRFCSRTCGDAWRNDQTRLATLRVKQVARRPCDVCGQPIPPTRATTAIYCSPTCKMHGGRSASPKARSSQQDANRMRLHGVSREAFDSMLDSQAGKCAICGTSTWPGKGPHVDHDHATGALRGILCHDCNLGLGNFKDDLARLRAAAEYLERYRERAM
jgi:predicted nucleic acid-binding Zn ribbon protein